MKTAGGIGLVNVQNELLDKGIMYKANMEHGTKLQQNGRMGRSTDATGFRRSLVFNGGVLENRENSSSPKMRINKIEDEVITQNVASSIEQNSNEGNP